MYPTLKLVLKSVQKEAFTWISSKRKVEKIQSSSSQHIMQVLLLVDNSKTKYDAKPTKILILILILKRIFCQFYLMSRCIPVSFEWIYGYLILQTCFSRFENTLRTNIPCYYSMKYWRNWWHIVYYFVL